MTESAKTPSALVKHALRAEEVMGEQLKTRLGDNEDHWVGASHVAYLVNAMIQDGLMASIDQHEPGGEHGDIVDTEQAFIIISALVGLCRAVASHTTPEEEPSDN